MRTQTKRNPNQIGLKVKFLGPTNTIGPRIKFTLTNTCKSITANYDDNFDTINNAFNVLDKCRSVISYNAVIDNTQNEYYLISVLSYYDIYDEIKSILK